MPVTNRAEPVKIFDYEPRQPHYNARLSKATTLPGLMLASGSEACQKKRSRSYDIANRDRTKFVASQNGPAVLFFEECVQAGLRDRLIDLRFGATRGDATENLSVEQNGQAPLVRKEVRIGERFQVVLLYCVFGSF